MRKEKIVGFFKKIPQFLREVKLELKKVSWPTVEETWKKTFLVISVSIIVAIFLGGLDALFTWLINFLASR